MDRTDKKDTQAIRPNFLGEFASLQSLKKIEVTSKDKNDPETEALFILANSSGWKILETYIDDLIKELHQSIRELMAAGATFEEIGQRTAVKELTTNVLEKIKDKVQDAKDAGNRDA